MIKKIGNAIFRGGAKRRVISVLCSWCVAETENRIKRRRIAYWTNLTSLRLSELPETTLSEEEKKLVEAFYSKYTDVNLLFHQFYKAATGRFDVRNIPDDFYYSVVDPYFNDWSMGNMMDNKTFYRWYFPDVKQPLLICYRQNGFWLDENRNLISEDKAISKILEADMSFVKAAESSMGGHGIIVVKAKESSKEKLGEVLKNYTCDIVVQKKMDQSDVMSRINESSVNTIRIMTFLRKDGTVKICSASLRMGLAGSFVDNASSGGITCGIQENGQLNAVAYSPSGKSCTEHPTSGVIFSEIKLSNYDKVKALVCREARRMPKFRLISWDIALDKEEEPMLIETNLFVGELEFHQLNNGPIFGDETKSILDEIYENPKRIRYPF